MSYESALSAHLDAMILKVAESEREAENQKLIEEIECFSGLIADYRKDYLPDLMLKEQELKKNMVREGKHTKEKRVRRGF